MARSSRKEPSFIRLSAVLSLQGSKTIIFFSLSLFSISDAPYRTFVTIKLDEALNAQVIAVLRRDGKRVDAAASEIKSVSKSGYDEPGTDIQAQITVGDLSEGEYELSVYLWDGLGNMKILAPCKVFREQAE